MGRNKKDPFESIPDEFKTQVNGLNREDIKKLIAKVACDNVELMKAKKDDMQLEEAKLTYRDAGEVYREGAKLNKAKIELMKQTLDNLGG